MAAHRPECGDAYLQSCRHYGQLVVIAKRRVLSHRIALVVSQLLFVPDDCTVLKLERRLVGPCFAPPSVSSSEGVGADSLHDHDGYRSGANSLCPDHPLSLSSDVSRARTPSTEKKQHLDK